MSDILVASLRDLEIALTLPAEEIPVELMDGIATGRPITVTLGIAGRRYEVEMLVAKSTRAYAVTADKPSANWIGKV